jgi:fructose-1,6-bisphosphatase/inositol monophosphatase family enzyme
VPCALDLVHDHRARLADLAGAAAVVLEAGGVLTGVHGTPVFPGTREQLSGDPMAILAGNRESHADALADIPYLSRA